MAQFLVINALLGAAAGALFGAVLLLTDADGLWSIVVASPEPYLMCAVIIAFRRQTLCRSCSQRRWRSLR